MAVAWFFAPYKRRDDKEGPGRYCAIADFSAQIEADGGRTSSPCECLGNYAVVKVKASDATLDVIDATPGFERIPLGRLDDPTASLTLPQRTRVQNRLQALGYTAAEINTRFPAGWSGPYVLRDILAFALSRCFEPYYDAASDTIKFDATRQVRTRPYQHADREVA